MYLKEIKISGFKSFADKININLDNEITCIVGPNGSGKSNIIDAVRWVLGEQSIKSLRGTNNMTDVIFSGSKSRNPLNLASVSLIFDNSDSYIKVPYSEISVTRKVYRSGETEYYLNNEKCRLKDINDLFIDSGMGKYAFNIISQGEINKIISDSPTDRRIIFEEAAGVLKYKKRKEEALKKLEKTNENLNRVHDIISEIEGQIEPLKEQSIQAKKYLDNKEKLESIEIALIANDLEKLNFSFHEGKKTIEDLQNKIVDLSTNTTNNDIDIEHKKEKLIKLNEEITSFNKEYIELTKEEEKINGEKNIIKERSKYDSEDLKIHDNVSHLKEQQLIINNKILSLKTDIDILIKQGKETTNKLFLKTEKFKALVSSKNILDNNLLNKKKDITDLEYKIKYLNDYIEEGGNTSPSVKKILSNPRIKGIHNTISRLIETDDNYALALDIALGGAKDYVVVDNPSIAKMCINYLKENNYGRVTFFPLDVIKPRTIENEILNLLKKEPGFIDVFASLVHYDSTYYNIIFNQLGNVLLVDNIDNANSISKKINNRFKIVTLQGEIINVGGSITGGSIKQRSIINEKYELQSLITRQHILEKEVIELENKIDEESRKIKEEQQVLLDLEKEKLLIQEDLNNKNNSYEMIKKEYEEKELELDNLNDLINENISQEEEKIVNKYYDVLNKKELLGKKVVLITKEKEDLTSEIEELQASFRVNNSTIRELENTLKELEIKNTSRSVKMDNLLNILSENYEMTFEKAKSNYILEIEESIARKNVNDYRRELKNIGTVNLGAIEEYERINKRYDFLIKQNEDLENAIKTLLSIIDELDVVMKDEFFKTFKEIEAEFNKVFRDLFEGGTAKLSLTDANNILETGIDISVTPPGKKVSVISLLSGGEKTLTAISLLFAILNIKKIPFCLFDEIEAALDEVNVDKVGNYFNKYVGKTQLIVITHKKKTMEYANTLYGITMQESGVSKLVSVKLVD